MNDRPILMFDSGIGGLTVLREARVLMPGRRFVYVADDAAFPYGAWEEPALRDHILALFAKLLDRFCPEISVIACNTASTLVIGALRDRFPGHPFHAFGTRLRLGDARDRETPIHARPDQGLGVEMSCPVGRERQARRLG
jgi:glutamate racemase